MMDVAAALAFAYLRCGRCVVALRKPGFDDHQMPDAIDPEARRVALALLARGILRPHEAAELAGVSLQVVDYWLRRAGHDWDRIRRRRLSDAWRKEMQRGPRLVEVNGKGENARRTPRGH